MKPAFFIYLFFVLISDAFSQDSARFTININSNIPEAKIYIDSINSGTTPLSNFKLSGGVHNIKIIHPLNTNETSWEYENSEFKNFLLKSDTSIFVSFRILYIINSDPFNTSVFKSDSLLGYTPLRFFSESSKFGSLQLKKEGYKTKVIDLNNYSGTPVNIFEKLIPEINYQTENIIYKDKSTSFAKKRNVPLLIGLGLTTLGGAFATINLKNKANNYYDNYQQNLNASDLNNSSKYDVYSLISLILTQAALGTLIYFLFFD